MTVLVVDDDPIVLSSCRRVLEGDGVSVDVVADADQAIVALHERPYCLVLVDVKMPNRDGFSLIREIRQVWPALPIVVMSGYDTAETVAEGMRLGANRFIAKPFSPDELLQAVRSALSKEEAHAYSEDTGHR